MSVKQKKYSIYRITCIDNGKIYIGKTEQNPPEKRWATHIAQLKDPERRHYLHNSIITHGIENFIFEVIAECKNSEDLRQLEIDLIKYYNCNNRSVGYNLTDGGDGASGYKHTEEAKQRMSEIKKQIDLTGENNSFYGKHHSEDTKQLISKLNSERYIGEGNPFFGKTHTEETRQKLRDNHFNKEKYFSDKECDEIRSQYKFRKNTYKMLADKYKVCTTTIEKIVRREGPYSNPSQT